MIVVVCVHVLPTMLAAQEACDAPWRLEETLRLGSVDGGEVTFAPVWDLDVGPGGRIYLVQGWVPEVSVFLPDGRPAGTIGRAGEGPGEFPMSPLRLGWRGDTLWVSDRFTTHFFSADGAAVRQVSFETRVPSEGSIFRPGTPLVDASFLPQRSVTSDSRLFYLADGVPLVRLSTSGEIVDTLAIVDQHLAPFTIVRKRDANGWGGVLLRHPLAYSGGESQLPVAANPDGTAVVLLGAVRDGREDARFDLLKIRFDGDTLLHRSISYAPRRITQNEETRLREGFGALLAGDYYPDSMRRPMSARESERKRRLGFDLITFPEHHPPVRKIVAGHDGSIWLLRESSPSPADLWEIYGEDGRLEGSVRITGTVSAIPWNPRLEIFRATRTEVWGMTTDDLEVPYIHRYRVVRSGC